MKTPVLSGRLIVSDDLWKAIEPLIRAVKGPQKRRPNELSERMFVEAILHQARTGNPWRDMPREFDGWNASYHRFRRWERWGLWKRIWKQFQTLKPASALSAHRFDQRESASARRWRRPEKAGDGKILRRPDHQTACRLRQ